MAVAVPYIVIVVAMGYTRQGAALGIIMAGLADYLRRESIMRLAAYIAFAATFHATAVLAFILVAADRSPQPRRDACSARSRSRSSSTTCSSPRRWTVFTAST